MSTPEINYKNRKIKVTILWEKTYYHNDFIGGTEKEKWSGVLFLYRFLILDGLRIRFMIEPIIEGFRGYNEQEMVDALEERINGLEEWALRGKNFKDADFFPAEVNQNLIKFNLQKYVKEIS